MNKLENKIIIITGGNGLLGKEFINFIKREGGICINLDINHKTNSDLSNINCNITNSDEVLSSLNLIIKKYHRIDGLINNAYPRTSDWGVKFEETPLLSWKKNIDDQLNSHFFITQQISKFMLNNKCGSIINIASIYGIQAPDFSIYENIDMLNPPAAYSAIKGGLINLTKYLASYLGPNNIRVNSISPGGIFNNQNPHFVINYSKKVPLQRMGTPQDIAPAVVFLLSDDSKYITGHNLIIDGGWTIV